MVFTIPFILVSTAKSHCQFSLFVSRHYQINGGGFHPGMAGLIDELTALLYCSRIRH